MRHPLIAGNWKMNLFHAEAVELAAGIAQGASEAPQGVEIALFPPSIYLKAVAAAIDGSPVRLGGQNMYHQDNGAFTGEISAAMLGDVGCQFVILGHSERRHILGENDESVNRKAKKALGAALTPIICVGELLEERERGETDQVIKRQIDSSLADLSADQFRRLVIAYEPVWAIGTGQVATPEQAEKVHVDLRKLLEDRYNAEVAESVQILYGGSVKPENAATLLGQPNIDGALVGGASLKADDFLAIVAAAG